MHNLRQERIPVQLYQNETTSLIGACVFPASSSLVGVHAQKIETQPSEFNFQVLSRKQALTAYPTFGGGGERLNHFHLQEQFRCKSG